MIIWNDSLSLYKKMGIYNMTIYKKETAIFAVSLLHAENWLQIFDR